ncbi:MAG: nucleotidyltransferase domain-containing protein [Firmicutes bacterium]|nr:nucleotidyltransferase domain-containing protein [Bacillota bacterium]
MEIQEGISPAIKKEASSVRPRPEDLAVAQEVKRRLARHVRLYDFRLFGSRARGTANSESDMDIYLETDDLTEEQQQIIRDIVWEIGFERNIVIVPSIFTKAEVENSPLKASPFYKTVKREGVAL